MRKTCIEPKQPATIRSQSHTSTLATNSKEGSSSGELTLNDQLCDNGDVIHDLMWDGILPNDGRKVTDSASTWPGSEVIRNGYDHFGSPYTGSTIRTDSYHAYDRLKAFEAGDSTALDQLKAVDAAYAQTNNTVKFVHEEVLRIITEHTSSTPFFYYLTPPSMRVPGTTVNLGSLADQMHVYEKMKTHIEACDHWDYSAMDSLEPGSGLKALYDRVGASYWDAAIQDLVTEYFCDDDAKRDRFNTLVYAYSVDKLLGMIQDTLVQKGMWDNTLLVSVPPPP